jgi:hypothetical protein
MRYQEARGQTQTGTVDRDLLAQLREDPAPIAKAEPRAVRSYPPRRSDPLEPVRAAAQRFDQFMQSLLR